jgi:transaldolase
MTTIVADAGDLGAVARLKPVDCDRHSRVQGCVDEALAWGRKQSGGDARLAAATADRLAVSVAVELLRLVPGYVSTEADANLSFNIRASIARARQIVDAYKQRGVGPERVLIKLASTWEGDTRRTDPPTRGCEAQHDVVAEPGASDRQR